MKNNQTGWEGKQPVYEYVLYDTKRCTKTSVKSTSDNVKCLFELCGSIESISPSIAQRKKLYMYKSVDPSKFI